MKDIIRISCDSCGATIGSSDIYGSIVHCPGCHSYKIISDSVGTLKPVFYRISRFSGTANLCTERLMKRIAEICTAAAIKKLKPGTSVKRLYIPVREYGIGVRRYYIPLNDERKDLISVIFPNGKRYTNNIPIKEQDFSDLSVIDYRPVYEQIECDKIEMLPANVPVAKVDAMNGVEPGEMLVVKYLPVFTLGTFYGTLVCIGTESDFEIQNDEILKESIEDVVNWKNKILKKIYSVPMILMYVGCAMIIIIILLDIIKNGFSISHIINALLMAVVIFFGAVFGVIIAAIIVIFSLACFAPIPLFLYCLFKPIKKRNSLSTTSKDIEWKTATI